MTENLRNFTRAVYGMDAVVARVPADAWDNPSPCEGWTARDVVAHAAGILQTLSKMVEGDSMLMPKNAEGDDPQVAWAEARDSALAALDQSGVLQREGSYWFGPMSVDDLIGFVQWDSLTHSWDLAAATGVGCVIDEDLLRLSFERISSIRTPLSDMKQIVDAVEVAADAPLIERYIAMTGRDPDVGRATTSTR